MSPVDIILAGGISKFHSLVYTLISGFLPWACKTDN